MTGETCVPWRRGASPTGLTPGKWLFGIRSVDAQGLPPGVVKAIKRSITLLFEWTTLIALIAIRRDPNAQRIGDRWAGTYVIRAPRGGASVVEPRLATA